MLETFVVPQLKYRQPIFSRTCHFSFHQNCSHSIWLALKFVNIVFVRSITCVLMLPFLLLVTCHMAIGTDKLSLKTGPSWSDKLHEIIP